MLNLETQSVSANHSRMVLGGAQLGLHYGITNRTGFLTDRDAVDIIRAAVFAGIRTIDTARAYGESERRIGLALSDGGQQAIELITKLDPLQTVAMTAPPEQAVDAASKSVSVSRSNLGRDHLDCLILHRPDHRTSWDGAVWQMLLAERDAGRIKRLGVSVNYPEDALAAIADPDVSHIQIPFNLLDYRWEEAGVLRALQQRPHITVHIRSVFLQGLLANKEIPKQFRSENFDLSDLNSRVRQLASHLDRVNEADLCIAFARAQTWASGIVVGVESIGQLNELVGFFDRPALTLQEVATVTGMMPRYPEDLLVPAQWALRGPPADPLELKS